MSPSEAAFNHGMIREAIYRPMNRSIGVLIGTYRASRSIIINPLSSSQFIHHFVGNGEMIHNKTIHQILTL
jgi:hypothetical protein